MSLYDFFLKEKVASHYIILINLVQKRSTRKEPVRKPSIVPYIYIDHSFRIYNFDSKIGAKVFTKWRIYYLP